jgi:hypothetical protein
VFPKISTVMEFAGKWFIGLEIWAKSPVLVTPDVMNGMLPEI